jgi:hypothetical protein
MDGVEITRTRLAIGLLGTSLISLAGCASPLEAPSAYASERFLCEPQDSAEFDAQVSGCRESQLRDGSCVGFVSMKGNLDGQFFVTDAPLFEARYEYDETKPNVVRSVMIRARSPYFTFRFSTENLTKETTESGTVCRTIGANLFNLEARGSSYNETLVFKDCELGPRADGFYFSFAANVVAGGNVDACTYLIAPRPPAR